MQPDYSNDIFIEETYEWHRYLKSNTNQIFLFPEPTMEDIGKMYQFERREELIDFLRRDPLVNPEVKYISSKDSLKTASLLEMMHSESIIKIIEELFTKINTNIHKEQNKNEINKLIDSMNVIISTKVHTYEDISRILREQIQNQQEYETYYQKIAEFNEFYSFLDKYISKEEWNVPRKLQSLASQTLTELQKISNS